ncbi:Wadjet anti-phage system protein JetD domain-containing protein [Filimonas effusa]|uniref:DUF3322 and DUF2220 domain-containing protein n=1 Tax=Filimonas effusa TaxID=2508721 RepID=A0A4Q1D5A1_9BACT|nr:Wadjet anti-phage system protein JetD domain-containing protein [Filimonas effusa]RXK83670.1 hypothetical protein ESB13_16445 [Filimonas effusa]
MLIDQYISQLEKHYQSHLRRLIMEQPFEVIILFGGKKRPETTKELHERIRLFQAHEKSGSIQGWLIDWEDWNSKKLGKQKWPARLTVQTEDDLVALLDKTNELDLFRTQLKEILQWDDRLRVWLAAQPRRVLELQPEWNGLKEVLTFLLNHDVKGQYLRSLPVAVHTKFIKTHEPVLLSILKHLLPETVSLPAISLEAAFGMAQKPFLYPARWLDPTLAEMYTHGMEVLGLSPDGMRKLSWELDAVCVVENETNLYLLPQTSGMLAVCGWGKALSLLRQIPLLNRTRLFYWGDLDEDGFLMLNNFRELYPHVQSLLMDEKAVLAHEREMLKQPAVYQNRLLPFLTLPERAAYQKLAAVNGRIEQEKLQQKYLQDTLAEIL